MYPFCFSRGAPEILYASHVFFLFPDEIFRKVRPIFQSFPITNCFPTTASPASSRTNRCERHQKKRFWWMMPDFFIFRPRMHLCSARERQRDKRGKSENFPITGWQRWYSRAKRMARFCLLIYLWHEIAWNDRSCLVDLFSNANMELGVPATGPVRMIWGIKGIF